MKFIVVTILTALLAFISGLFLPWWCFAITSLLLAIVLPLRPAGSFFAGFLGVFLLWAGLAFWIDMKNNGVLASKIAAVLPLGGNAILLIIVTGFIGGIVSGMAALTGSFALPAPRK